MATINRDLWDKVNGHINHDWLGWNCGSKILTIHQTCSCFPHFIPPIADHHIYYRTDGTHKAIYFFVHIQTLRITEVSIEFGERVLENFEVLLFDLMRDGNMELDEFLRSKIWLI